VLSAALPVKNPVVVCCGATAFADTGDAKKMAAAKLTTLLAPHRLVGTALDGVTVTDVISGPCAGHTVALTDGGVFAWGKNHRGQLGVGDEETKHGPCLVEALKKETVVHAACGKV
jgi:alpha-tubulin suppressor-like RCC1 family protein